MELCVYVFVSDCLSALSFSDEIKYASCSLSVLLCFISIPKLLLLNQGLCLNERMCNKGEIEKYMLGFFLPYCVSNVLTHKFFTGTVFFALICTKGLLCKRQSVCTQVNSLWYWVSVTILEISLMCFSLWASFFWCVGLVSRVSAS